MKEFAMKHPILTFILADITFYNIFNVINNALRVKAMKNAKEEMTQDESANDIQ